ncbi:MAG TPA: hypothetical protein DCS23_00720 [Candidatus Yonathbacteria bacterium]|nr:hypothetical protein [Candidatus Yonathbacteria bacterium]
MTSLSKILQKFFVIFFTAVSVVLVFAGITRIKKEGVLATATTPEGTAPLSPSVLSSATTITGKAYQTPWGNAVASITVKDGKIIATNMPSIPDSPPSVYAEPFLVEQALRAGSANIQGVSGATYTSIAFKSSLESAIAKANTEGQSITANIGSAITTSTAKPAVPKKYRKGNDHDDDEWDDDHDDD